MSSNPSVRVEMQDGLTRSTVRIRFAIWTAW